MQTLGRISIITGLIAVAALNLTMFAGVGEMSAAQKAVVYGRIYLLALIIPLISVTGVILGGFSLRLRARKLRQQKISEDRIERMLYQSTDKTHLNGWIVGGSLVFVVFTLSMGLGQVPFAQEIVLNH